MRAPNLPVITWWVLCGLAVLGLAPGARAQDARIDKVIGECQHFDDLREAGKFGEAENYIQGLIASYRQAGDAALQYYLQSNLVELLLQQRRYAEALPLAEAATRGCQQHWGATHTFTGQVLVRLGRAYQGQRRTDEALALYRRARKIAVAKEGEDGHDVRHIDSLTADALSFIGRYQEAERLRLHVLAVARRQSQGRATEAIANELHNLGSQYHDQSRHREAEKLLLEACQVYRQAGLGESLQLANTFNLLGNVYSAHSHYPEAIEAFRQSHELYVKLLGPDHPLSTIQESLAEVYVGMQQFDQADSLLRQSLESALRHYGPDSAQVFDIQQAIWSSLMMQEKHAEADQICEQLERHASQPQIPPRVLGAVYRKRAITARFREHFDEACRYGLLALDVQEEQRANLSGGEQEQAESNAAAHFMFSLTALDHLLSGKLPEAFAISERGRGRLLLDQMATGQVDLFAGLPAEKATRLRAAYEALRNQVAELERQVASVEEGSNLSSDEKKQQLAGLGSQLDAARSQLAAAYAQIRNESPILRRVIGQNFDGVSLAELQAYLDQQRAALLYYIVGPDGVVLLGIDGEEQVATAAIRPDAEAAQTLGISPDQGFGNAAIAQLLSGDPQNAILPDLMRPDPPASLAVRLSALTRTLIPSEILALLREDRYDRLIIVPDGPLAMLPFEALVVEAGAEPKYLLDAGPAIHYAPSATVLLNLGQRAEVPIPADRDPVLTVGDPAYGASPTAGESAVLDRAYRSRGGQLARLPYSGLEATWVAQNFAKHGVKAGTLRQAKATEAAVRANAPLRRIVHLACHGLTDDEHGNFFAALALAPGTGGKANARDDGFLTLTELYELDLRACELAVLSACQTNYGPQHEGEGAWALSRGFLVAGSRRVVASNWLVDDKAGASLVSYFASVLAKQPPDQRDYPQALAEAKRWARSQPQWKAPYYWATFLLIGPK